MEPYGVNSNFWSKRYKFTKDLLKTFLHETLDFKFFEDQFLRFTVSFYIFTHTPYYFNLDQYHKKTFKMQ